MELSMIGSVIIGLTIFELLYWLVSVIVNPEEKEKLDQEAVDYLIQSSSKKQNTARQTKEKKED
jgi:hypothetical protein